MSDKMRWRYGDTNPVVAAVDSSTEIEIGDLLFQEIDDARPASAQANYGGDQDNREQFADCFLGVAMQRSRSGDTSAIRVATTGVFEFDCPSSTFELGDLVGADGDGTDDGLLDQQVTSVGATTRAVGRVAKRVATAATSVLVDVRSTVMTGGVEGSSLSGV